jgi:uncharacterized membrane protein
MFSFKEILMKISFHPEGKIRGGLRKAAKTIKSNAYGLALGTSLCVSILLIILFRYGHPAAGPSGDLMHELKNGINCLVNGFAPEWAGPCVASPEKATLEVINRKIHSPPGFGNGILQIAGVIALSFTWFFTAISHNKTRIVLSGIATVAYVYGMFSAYQPAVFVAALIAILAAAEHLGALKKQGAQFDEQLTLLNTAADHVSRIANSTQLSLTPAGKTLFLREVFGAYSRARTVYAVVRDHSIEDNWWSLAMQADIARDGLAAVWDAYYRPAEPGGELNLYRALTQAREDHTIGVKSAHFVSYMPMPGSPDWKPDDAQLFSDLLGLAWECLILDELRNTLNIDGAVGEWISRPLCWAHATENEVLQIIKREPISSSEPFSTSFVLKTADVSPTKGNTLDLAMSKKIIESTHAEIRRYLQRGIPVEEYLSAVLCYAAADDDQAELHEDPDSHIRDLKIETCLGRIGMRKWLEKRPHDTGDKSRKVAVALFKQFIHLSWRRSIVGLDPETDAPTNRSLGLAREVL